MVNLTGMLDELMDTIQNAYSNAEKFQNRGNKSAGTRVRKTMQEVKTQAQNIRIAISEMKKEE